MSYSPDSSFCLIILLITEFPHFAHSYLSLHPLLTNQSLFSFHFLSIVNLSLVLHFSLSVSSKPHMYANNAKGRRYIGVVSAAPCPQLCALILSLMHFVVPMYVKFWCLRDKSMYTYQILIRQGGFTTLKKVRVVIIYRSTKSTY